LLRFSTVARFAGVFRSFSDVRATDRSPGSGAHDKVHSEDSHDVVGVVLRNRDEFVDVALHSLGGGCFIFGQVSSRWTGGPLTIPHPSSQGGTRRDASRGDLQSSAL